MGSYTHQKNLERIQILQNKCVRIMTFAPFRANANPIFQKLELLKICDIIKVEQLKLVNDFYCNRLPEGLMSLFKLKRDVQTVDITLMSTYNNLLHVPSFKTMTYGKNPLDITVLICGIKLSNTVLSKLILIVRMMLKYLKLRQKIDSKKL